MRTPVLATLVMTTLLAAGTASAAVNVQQNSDGTYYTGVLVNGAASKKYNIVFVGDGFTAAQQNIFNIKVDQAVAALGILSPYKEQMCSLNIWRVNVVSAQSGVDHPMDSIWKNTELDCRYGNTADGEAERCITSDSPEKCHEAAGYAPAADAVFVLVNDTQWGGCAGDLVFSSISGGFSSIITHELGHKIGALADEYQCYVCDGSDDGVTYSGAEPSEVNVTKAHTYATLKWNDLVDPSTPIPTTVNSPYGVVGAWEGGMYAAQGIYRPQASCQMSSGGAFCKVCSREMDQIMAGYCYCDLYPWACLEIEDIVACRFPCLDIWWTLDAACMDCPDYRRFDEMEVILEGLDRSAKVQIVDRRGAVVGVGVATSRGVSAKFGGDRAQRYFIHVTNTEAANQSKQYRATVLRNGVKQLLSGGFQQQQR
jgi:hypothetical protein